MPSNDDEDDGMSSRHDQQQSSSIIASVRRGGCGLARRLAGSRIFVAVVVGIQCIGAAMFVFVVAPSRNNAGALSTPFSSESHPAPTTAIGSAPPTQQQQQPRRKKKNEAFSTIGASTTRATERAANSTTSPSGTVAGESGVVKEGESSQKDVGKPGTTTVKIEHLADEEDKQLGVYVYQNIPSLDFSPLIQCYRDAHEGVPPWQDERADMVQDMGEIWIHRALLSHPWRVFDPEEADLFYVPIYPVLSMKLGLRGGSPSKADKLDVTRCGGLTHEERMDRAVKFLSRGSPFFNRFGGGDHLIVCSWWNCRLAISPWQRMLLRRTGLGINEKKHEWSRWGCGTGKMITVPYVASSILTTQENLLGRPLEDRDIPFFFVGSDRNRPERKNLRAVKTLSKDSIILLGGDYVNWGMNSTEYASHVARSRFCFCPRGDTQSSRRIFDAISAGCIPIITELGRDVLPFLEVGLNYSEFAVVVERGAFETREGVRNTTMNILSRSDEEIARMQHGLRVAASSILYGITSGEEVGDMHPFIDASTNFLRASYAAVSGAADSVGNGAEAKNKTALAMSMWSCPGTHLPAKKLAPRTEIELPPPAGLRRRWLAESETMIDRERSLLLCAPPHTGSLQFRMLAKRMQDIPHWSVSNNRTLLFDPTASGLELLDIGDGPLMKQIYRDNGSGWINIAVVRDPVTRLLSAYLGLVRNWRAGLKKLHANHRQQWRSQQPERPSHDGKRGEGLRDLRGVPVGGMGDSFETPSSSAAEKEPSVDQIEEADREMPLLFWQGPGGWDGPAFPPASEWSDEEIQKYVEVADGEVTVGAGGDGGDAGKGGGKKVISIPTFQEVVEALVADLPNVPPPFRPCASMCGQEVSHFDSVIPFERLEKTSAEVLKSLPMDIWEKFGNTGWGPDGEHAFMEFDYGGTPWSRSSVGNEEGEPGEGDPRREIPGRTRDLFEGDSCAWAEYYVDMETLEAVGSIYSQDYAIYSWYTLEPWQTRLQACMESKRRL